ncbi:hypothetical protein ACVMIX_006602 [Rhizobium leguminosarum]
MPEAGIVERGFLPIGSPRSDARVGGRLYNRARGPVARHFEWHRRQTDRPFRRAARPRPSATCVFPVPLGPSAMTFLRRSIHPHRISSSTCILLSFGMAAKPKLSRPLMSGNRAALMRRSTLRRYHSILSLPESRVSYSCPRAMGSVATWIQNAAWVAAIEHGVRSGEESRSPRSCCIAFRSFRWLGRSQCDLRR